MDRSIRTSLLVLMALTAGCSRPAAGKIAPDFIVEQVEPPASEVKLSSMKGHPVLVDFWATWCGPCRETMPAIEKIYQKYKDKGLEVMAVTDEKRAVIRSFRPDSGVTYPMYLDVAGQANQGFQIEGIPHLFLVDKKGNIVYDEVGAPLNEEALTAAIEAALR